MNYNIIKIYIATLEENISNDQDISLAKLNFIAVKETEQTSIDISQAINSTTLRDFNNNILNIPSYNDCYIVINQ